MQLVRQNRICAAAFDLPSSPPTADPPSTHARPSPIPSKPCQEEAARRLQSAKRAAPPAPAPAAAPKRQRQAEEEEAGAGLEEEEDGGGDGGAPKPAPGVKVRRGVVLDDDDDE